MKKNRFNQYAMIASLLFTCVTTSYAQVNETEGAVLVDYAKKSPANTEDAYRKAVKDYIAMRPSVLGDMDVKEIMSEFNNKVLLDYDSDQLDILLKKYHDTKLLDDCIDYILMPSFKGILSIEELKELTALYQTSEGQTFLEHEAAFNNKIKSSNLIEFSMDNAFKALRRGDRLEDVKRDKGISKKYVKKFYESVDTSMISLLMTPLHDIILKEADAEGNPHLTAVLEHQRKNLSTILLNCSYGILTEEDLDFEKRLNNMVAQEHAITVLKNMMANITQYSQNWMLAYAKWLLEQPEVCDYILQKSADEVNVESAPEDFEEDMKATIKLEPGAYIMEFEIEDVKVYNNLRNEIQDEIREIVLKEKEFLQIIANSKRRFTLKFIAQPNGLISSVTETWIDNSELYQMLDNFDALKAGIRGKKMWKKGQYEKAFPLLKQAAEADDVASQLKVAAMMQFGKGVTKDDDEAMKWYNKVANQNDNLYYKAEALNQMAYYYAGHEQFDKAIATIDQAIETMPEEPNYYDSKGEILYRKGDKKEAKAMWQKVLSLDPDFANAHNSTLYFLLYGKKK